MIEEPSTVQLVLPADGVWSVSDGPSCAIYVVVSDDGKYAKIGLVGRAVRTVGRLKEIQDAWHEPSEVTQVQYRMAVVAEIEGLVRTGEYEDAPWNRAQAIEAAMRLAIASRVGDFSPWYEWLEVTVPLTDVEWAEVVREAWVAVQGLAIKDS